MKLVTINTHSLIEENYPQKLESFVDFIALEQPDLIAMQEVNQSIDAPVYQTTNNIPLIREDNHALQAALKIRSRGLYYYWTWLPIKIGYGKYDEGVAFFSKKPFTLIDSFYISKFNDYNYWKTRKALGVKISGYDDLFFTMHMGWWNDEEDPFPAQWERFQKYLSEMRFPSNIWLLGDFNSPSEVRKEGYDLIKASGFHDTYDLAKEKDNGITVLGVIDGWKDKMNNPDSLEGMRIDHIWCSKPHCIHSSKVVFNGQNYPVISDHFGILIETDESIFTSKE